MGVLEAHEVNEAVAGLTVVQLGPLEEDVPAVQVEVYFIGGAALAQKLPESDSFPTLVYDRMRQIFQEVIPIFLRIVLEIHLLVVVHLVRIIIIIIIIIM